MIVIYSWYKYFGLQDYNIVLLIPDIVDRSHVKEMMNVLLLRMGFAQATMHQVS